MRIVLFFFWGVIYQLDRSARAVSYDIVVERHESARGRAKEVKPLRFVLFSEERRAPRAHKHTHVWRVWPAN
jgi:hypothetical protein